MPIERKNPSFRKVISPWYDSTPLCVVSAVIMALILVFAIIGLDMAIDAKAPGQSIWVPAALGISSFWVLASLVVRLIRRYMDTGSEPL